MRGRVVIDLNGNKSTQAVYTALTRTTNANLLTLTPATDMTQWTMLRFSSKVYSEHLWLTQQQVHKTMGPLLPLEAKLFLNDPQLIERVTRSAKLTLTKMMNDYNTSHSSIQEVMGKGVRLMDLKLLQKQTDVKVIVDVNHFTFNKLCSNLDHQGFDERFAVVQPDWFESLEGLPREKWYFVAKGLFIKWCKTQPIHKDPYNFEKEIPKTVLDKKHKQVTENQWNKIREQDPEVEDLPFAQYCKARGYKIEPK